MFLRVEKGSAVPISRQIVSQISALCLAEKLSPGEKLPSVRQLARELAVNQNTILRVYERLTAQGLLEMRHGDGTYVALQLPKHQLAVQRRQFSEELSQLVSQGEMLGLTGAELHTMLDEALTSQKTAKRSTKGKKQ